LTDLADAYAEVQSRLAATVLALDDQQRGALVPACPDWTIADVVAHLAGGVVDVTSGEAEELRGLDLMDQWHDATVARARDSLTSREVLQRRGHAIESVIDEWRQASRLLFAMIRGEAEFPPDAFPFAGNILTNDVVVHEGDVREALGLDVAPEGVATSAALQAYAFSLDSRLRALHLPALVLRYEGKERLVGEGVPAASVMASRTTLVRMLASRLAPHEMRDLDWSGDPQPYLAVIPEYGPSTHT
jgi:uncharacterized protein (TIGR03083 family)